VREENEWIHPLKREEKDGRTRDDEKGTRGRQRDRRSAKECEERRKQGQSGNDEILLDRRDKEPSKGS
jgi:hypothetical protein